MPSRSGLAQRAPDHDAVGDLQRRCQSAGERARGQQRAIRCAAISPSPIGRSRPGCPRARYRRPGRRGRTRGWRPRSVRRIGTELNVGSRTLRVTRILISRPDQNATFVEFASTLLINDADLAATKLIQPGSRVKYALLLAGTTPQLEAFRHWHAAADSRKERLVDVAEASPQIGEASRRAARFLALASLVAVLLCAVAIAMSARSYVRRHLDVVALMKTLGASRRTVLGGQPVATAGAGRGRRASSVPPPAGSRSSGWCACCGGCCAATCHPPACGPPGGLRDRAGHAGGLRPAVAAAADARAGTAGAAARCGTALAERLEFGRRRWCWR